MAKNENFHKLTGTLKAAQLVKKDDYGRWWVKIVFDEPGLEAFKASGIQTTLGPDNSTYLRRSGTITKRDGSVVEMEPIKVYGPDRAPMDPMKLGWGSKIVVGVTTYPTKKGNGHRVSFIGVYELVEFNHTTDDDKW